MELKQYIELLEKEKASVLKSEELSETAGDTVLANQLLGKFSGLEFAIQQAKNISFQPPVSGSLPTKLGVQYLQTCKDRVWAADPTGQDVVIKDLKSRMSRLANHIDKLQSIVYRQ